MTEADGESSEINRLNARIREIAHDISSPVGVLRMAVFYLQTSGVDEAKRTEYYQLMNETIEKVEACLRRLRALTDGDAPYGMGEDRP